MSHLPLPLPLPLLVLLLPPPPHHLAAVQFAKSEMEAA